MYHTCDARQPIIYPENCKSMSQVGECFDLQAFLNPDPVASYFMRVEGDAMRDAGIRSGDVLLVDPNLEPSNNKIVVAALNDCFLVRRYLRVHQTIELLADNPDFKTIHVQRSDRLTIWGLVAAVVRRGVQR